MVDIIDINESLSDAQFKDDKPLKTVERIKGILRSHGIETEETWQESGVPHCYSFRITVKGTTFGVNGKGLTKEFATASGYGELMERLQLGFIGSLNIQKSGSASEAKSLDRMIPAKDILDRDRKWYEILSKKLYQYTQVTMTPEEILSQYSDPTGKVLATAYHELTKSETVYVPRKLRSNVYGSNGCAAGNTIEEAIVQAFSEIVERHNQLRVLTEQIPVPDIPEDVLRSFPVAYDIITYLRNSGLDIIIKDCSLGAPFPVVCVCYINKRTGRYHCHFGANPILEIALERALTESFQGRTIDKIAKFADFHFPPADSYPVDAVEDEFRSGECAKPPALFAEGSELAWNSNVGFSGKNNHELLRQVVAYFKDQGYQVLVRDASCLGFPTCQVIVPGYSEVLPHLASHDQCDYDYMRYAIKALRDPSKASISDHLGLLMHMSRMEKLAKRVSGAGTFTENARLSTKLHPDEDMSLMAASLGYAYFALGKYAQAMDRVDTLIRYATSEDEGYLICLKRYFSLMMNGYSGEKLRKTLLYFHDAQCVERLYACLAKKENPFHAFTLHCDPAHCEACSLYGKCGYLNAVKLLDLIDQKTAELDYTGFCRKLDALIRD